MAHQLHQIVSVSCILDSISVEYRYPFPMVQKSSWMEKRRAGAILVAMLIVSFAALTAFIPASDVSAHNVLHHLNFLPLMLAGMVFGWRGAAVAALAAGGMNAPNIAQDWVKWPLDAKDQIVELTIFSFAGLIAGYLSDRERAHRHNLEKTQKKLQDVYLELRENVAQMKKAERLSAAGQLAASLAHEIRNPLASISGAAGILQRGAAPAEYVRDSLEIIQKESQRLNKLLSGFLNFATPRLLRVQRTNVDEMLESVVLLASHAAEISQVKLEYASQAEALEVECDPEQLKQVLLNLVINAIEASPVHSQILLRTRTDMGRMIIEVEDRGKGMKDEEMERIFDPFFTTKPNGSGLGLAISSMIVSQHHGTLLCRRNPEQGTTFCLELPANQGRANV